MQLIPDRSARLVTIITVVYNNADQNITDIATYYHGYLLRIL